ADAGDRAGAAGARRRPVGGHRAAVARPAARAARARPCERPARRPGPAGLSQDAGRAAAGRAEPGAQALVSRFRISVAPPAPPSAIELLNRDTSWGQTQV